MADLTDLKRRIERGAERRVQLSAPVLQRQLQDAAPVAADGGGTMRDSTTAVATGLQINVVVGVDYATFTIEDTQPHEIRARRAQALRFFWPGHNGPGGSQPRFFQKVQHPGTSGTVDWYQPVVDDWNLILERVA
jgi:hypothetical protein